MPVYPRGRGMRRSQSTMVFHTRRTRRRYVLELLESRTLLSYTFSYNPVTMIATAVSDNASNDNLVIDQSGGDIEWSLNGSIPSSNWGGFAVPNLPTVNVDIMEGSGGANESITIGSPTGAISTITPVIAISGSPASSSLTLDDSSGTVPATGADSYRYNGTTFTGPGGFALGNSVVQTSGFQLLGSNQNDTFDVLGTSSGEAVTFTGGTGTNTVNLGSDPAVPASSSLSGIRSLVTVDHTPSTTTLGVFGAGDTASTSGAITKSGVSGLGFGSGGSVSYTGGTSSGVTSLVVAGGTHGGAGVTYNITGTSADTTINDGPNSDTVNVTGMGLATGTTLSLNDPGGDTLNYNAGGLVPTIAAGGPGEVIISLPGSGPRTSPATLRSISATSRRSRSCPAPASTINTIEGFRDVDANVGTFSLPTATLLPGDRSRRRATSPRRSTGATRPPTRRPARLPRTRAIRASITSPARTHSRQRERSPSPPR